MKICFMCDLHLPFRQETLQYDVLKWAIEDVKKYLVPTRGIQVVG